jgi:hypothetical protein
MHSCFNIPEIVIEICSHLRMDKPMPYPSWHIRATAHSLTPRLALLSLSRTCRQFYQPATEELWSSFGFHYGLDPLLDSIADDLWDFDFGALGARDSSSRVSR